MYLVLLILMSCFLCFNANADWTQMSVSINASENPGNVNGHYVMSGKRTVAIDGTVFSLVATTVDGYEAIWRSTDNGQTWNKWNTQDYYGRNGVILSGPDKTIYYFYNYAETFYMVKFAFDAASCPDRITIATVANWDTNGGAYNSLAGAIDEEGDVFVTYNRGSSQDGIFMIRSTDAGISWSSEIQIYPSGSGGIAISQQMAVGADNTLYIVVNEFADAWVSLARSTDNGDTWLYTSLAEDTGTGHCEVYNANIITKGEDDVFIFAQGPLLNGIIIKHSTDNGTTFGDWVLVCSDPYHGYGDPSPALASNGDLYVGVRHSHPDLTGTASSSALRAKVFRSTNNGISWTEVDCYCGDYRTATKTCMRYQTFWNYGGPLQWTWLQSMNASNTEYQVFFDINTDISIMAHPIPFAPEILISTPNKQTVFDSAFIIQGTTSAAAGRTISSVLCPNVTITSDDGAFDEHEESWTANVTLSDGLNSFVFMVTDSEGETGPGSINVTYEIVSEAPGNTISTLNNQTMSEPSFTIQGTARAANGSTISSVLSPNQTITADDGLFDEQEESWTANVTLSDGLNSFVFTVTDSEGGTGQGSINVTYEIVFEAPENTISTLNNQTVSDPSFTIQGTARAANGSTISSVLCPNVILTADDGAFDEQEESWTANVTLVGELNNFVFTATDSNGYTGQINFNINLESIVIGAKSESGCFISNAK